MFMQKSNKQTKNKKKWFRRGEISQISPSSSFLRAVILHWGQFCLQGDSCQWETLVVTTRAEGRGPRIAMKHSAMHRTASTTKNHPAHSVLSASVVVSWTWVMTISCACIFFQKVKHWYEFFFPTNELSSFSLICNLLFPLNSVLVIFPHWYT